MNDFSIKIAQQALDDIERNATWWATNYDVRHADNWSQKFHEEILRLAVLPASRTLAVEDPELSFNLRCFYFRGYRALFTISEDVVYVVAVNWEQQQPVEPNEIKYP